MSFILDALRKSEHERQRQTGPGLAEVAVAPPRSRTNVWATAAVVLLVVNLLAVGILLLRRSQREEPRPPAATDTVPASKSGPAAVQAPAAAQPGAGSPAARATVTQTIAEPPPMLRPAEAAPVVPATRNPLEAEVSGGSADLDPRAAALAAAPPAGPPAVSRTHTGGGSVVYETLPEAGLTAPAASSAAAPATGRPELPTADEVTAQGGVPDLQLQLHVYSNRPQERIAFINSHKYHEGDTLAEGPRVEEITPDGVVLSLNGRRFLLPRE